MRKGKRKSQKSRQQVEFFFRVVRTVCAVVSAVVSLVVLWKVYH